MRGQPVKSQEIRFLTVPSRQLIGPKDILAQPYRRIVGIQGADDNSILWSRQYPATTGMAYDMSAVGEEVLTVPRELGVRVGRFFSRHFAERPGAEKIDTSWYNCNGFARDMSRRFPRPSSADFALLDGIDKRRVVAASLDIGQMGVVGWRDETGGSALHSVVGLGSDSPDCLQVVAVGGALALDSYANVLDFYRTEHPDQDVQLFA